MSIREQLSKIVFKNKPDKTTPISAGNLNQLQDNIESALRKKFDYSVTYVTDANSMEEQGIYIINSVAVNLPFDPDEIITGGGLAWLIVISLSGFDPVIQIALESKTFNFWIRKSDYFEEGSWSEWKKMTRPERAIMSIEKARGKVNIPTAWEAAKIIFEKSNSSCDDRLIFENGCIKIGKNVNKVLVSGFTGGINRGDGGDKILKISVNDEDIIETYLSGQNESSYQQLNITPVLIDVEEDDEISLCIESGLAQELELLKTILTVEVIE